MVLLDAAEKALRAVRRPMHSKEIINFAVEQGWISPRGATPDHTLQALLWGDINKRGSKSRFRMVGEGRRHRRYWLRGVPMKD